MRCSLVLEGYLVEGSGVTLNSCCSRVLLSSDSLAARDSGSLKTTGRFCSLAWIRFDYAPPLTNELPALLSCHILISVPLLRFSFLIRPCSGGPHEQSARMFNNLWIQSSLLSPLVPGFVQQRCLFNEKPNKCRLNVFQRLCDAAVWKF